MSVIRRKRFSAASEIGVCTAVVCCAAVPHAQAGGYGGYLLGDGIPSVGAGGIAYSLVQDTTPLSANPALALPLGPRIDVSLRYDGAYASTAIYDNLLGANRRYDNQRRDFVTPYGGFAIPLSDTLALGMTGFFAGVGSAYDESPFERFGGDEQASLSLGQAGVSTALAFETMADQVLGISLNLSYQLLEIEGIQSFGLLSESPDHVSNQGADGALGIGFTIGWYGQLAPWLSAGAGYRSKTWSQKLDSYSGLLPNQGEFSFPATYGGGVALSPMPGVQLAFELQRVLYEDELAFDNSLQQLPEHRLGSDDGPGFGWRNQTIYKFGISYQLSRALCLRAGYGQASAQVIDASSTLFAAFAPNPTMRHYTLGATWENAHGWQFSGALAYSPTATQRGDNSIPLLFGGGEADVRIHSPMFGFSLSRRFDSLQPLDDLKSAARRAVTRLRR